MRVMRNDKMGDRGLEVVIRDGMVGDNRGGWVSMGGGDQTPPTDRNEDTQRKKGTVSVSLQVKAFLLTLLKPFFLLSVIFEMRRSRQRKV